MNTFSSQRGTVLVCALFATAPFAQGAAAADCPPGYSFQPGSGCVPTRAPRPQQRPPLHRYEAKSLDNSSVSYGLANKPHSPTPIYKARQQGFQGPIGPGPRRASDQASGGTHGIIFVGGHSASRLDKAALNPQPIPPGHALHKPPPGAPIEKTRHKKTPHWDLTKNNGV
ncbi:MAG: hypothetical protein ABI132_02600 [Rhodanobacteraceae bacterium]